MTLSRLWNFFRLSPPNTPESVGLTLIRGLRDGSIVLRNEPGEEPASPQSGSDTGMAAQTEGEDLPASLTETESRWWLRGLALLLAAGLISTVTDSLTAVRYRLS
jgi:hypothetical protein